MSGQATPQEEEAPASKLARLLRFFANSYRALRALGSGSLTPQMVFAQGFTLMWVVVTLMFGLAAAQLFLVEDETALEGLLVFIQVILICALGIGFGILLAARSMSEYIREAAATIMESIPKPDSAKAGKTEVRRDEDWEIVDKNESEGFEGCRGNCCGNAMWVDVVTTDDSLSFGFCSCCEQFVLDFPDAAYQSYGMGGFEGAIADYIESHPEGPPTSGTEKALTQLLLYVRNCGGFEKAAESMLNKIPGGESIRLEVQGDGRPEEVILTGPDEASEELERASALLSQEFFLHYKASEGNDQQHLRKCVAEAMKDQEVAEAVRQVYIKVAESRNG